tara:strand:+ start:67 stop:288 length:222 start_codon:yes stop_codon:yes gene_type:complete
MVDIKYVVFFSTFIVFSLESFLHFNIGKNGLTKINIPNSLEACEIIGVVILFSGINAILSKFIFNYKEKQSKN